MAIDIEKFMVRSKEDLIRGLEACQKADCYNCPYEDIGCSPVLAYDALILINNQKEQIRRLIIDAPILGEALDDKNE